MEKRDGSHPSRMDGRFRIVCSWFDNNLTDAFLTDWQTGLPDTREKELCEAILRDFPLTGMTELELNQLTNSKLRIAFPDD